MLLRDLAPPRLTRKFVGIVAVLAGDPSNPPQPAVTSAPPPATQPDCSPGEGGEGRGLSGWPEGALFNPPPHLSASLAPIWGRVGSATIRHRALPARETRKEPPLYLCLSFPTSNRPEHPRGSRPRPTSLSLPKFKLSPRSFSGGEFRVPPKLAPGKAAAAARGLGWGPDPLLLPSRGAPTVAPSARPFYLCPVAGPVPLPC